MVAILFYIGYVQADETSERKIKVDDSTFKCILKMTAVRHFFVDNLADNLAGTVAVAQAGKGEYPEGTVLQLIPNEAIVKRRKVSTRRRTIGSSLPSIPTRSAPKS